MWRRWNLISKAGHDARRTAAATILSAATLCPAATAYALEWKSPGQAKSAASPADSTVIASPERLPNPAIPVPTVAPPPTKVTKTSAQTNVLDPEVGVSERLELSNGTELVWITDQNPVQQRRPAKPTTARPTAVHSTTAKPQPRQPRTGAKPASLDTATALNTKALGSRTELARAETSKSTATKNSNACTNSANSCCPGASGSSSGSSNSSSSKSTCGNGSCCDGSCGSRCRGCGRLGCLGCGLCRRGDYMDRFANCSCDGSYKFPVPPLYTYHWPGMYSLQLMTDYHSPWRYPPLRPFTDEPTDDQLAPIE